MNQSARTITYVAVAGVLLGLAWAAGPRAVESLPEDETGAFFPTWKDPLAPTSLEVVEYDEDKGEVHPFKVMQVDGKWSIPSHANYPTDAERQLAEAAATVFELQKLSMVSKDKSTHSEYGVVDPDPATLKGSEEGVGKRVVLEDKQGKKLAQLIIGKEDKGQAGIRFVRVPGQDAVYRAEIRPDKLTTKFENWIEKDLLKVNTWDIKEIVLNSYSLDEVNGRIVPGDVLELTYDGDKSKWDLKDLKEGEELVSDKLNGLRDALDNLKIVDVRRKPDGLGRELRQAEGIQLDQEAVRNLASRGFFVFQGNLISNEGEAITRMKDGVVYVVRFGEIAVNTGGPADKKDEAAEGDDPAKDKADAAAAGANRYIFVMAQFDENQIAKPDLKPLPGETQPAPPENKTSQTGAASDDATQLAQAQDVKPAEKEDKDKPKAEEPEKPLVGEKKDETSKEEPKSKADQDRERKEIEKENKRKQDEYNDKVKKGQDRVKELNDRFADWYYVISDSEYKKIHLSRADVIKVKEGAEKSEDKTGVETFNKLKQEGLKE